MNDSVNWLKTTTTDKHRIRPRCACIVYTAHTAYSTMNASSSLSSSLAVPGLIIKQIFQHWYNRPRCYVYTRELTWSLIRSLDSALIQNRVSASITGCWVGCKLFGGSAYIHVETPLLCVCMLGEIVKNGGEWWGEGVYHCSLASLDLKPPKSCLHYSASSVWGSEPYARKRHTLLHFSTLFDTFVNS